MRPSFSENPLLRVSRPVSACSRCRSAKVRCDGKLPACTACEKAGRENECSSANDQFARGKERSYVAALELRIEKLQKRLAYAKLRKASVAQHDHDQQPPPPSMPPERKDSLSLIRAAIHRNAARKRENSDINSLVSDFGLLSVNATTRDFEPSVTNMTFARLVLAASVNEPLNMPTAPFALPPRQSAQATIQYYMENIYPLLPSFAETKLLNVMDTAYHDDTRLVDDADKWMLLLVLAIGSLAQSRRNGDQFHMAGTEYVAHALQYADHALAPGYPSQIQCLVLLTQYAMLDPAHFDSWLLVGFASRAAVDLGFHQDLPSQSAPEKAVLDLRRKIFYCVYALDRAVSMVHARAFSFTDDAVNVGFPSARVTQGLPLHGPQPADPSLLHFQLRRAQSHWYQDLCQSRIEAMPDPQAYIWRMCRDMREWNDQLPDSLSPTVRELFDLELRYSYVYCIGARAQLLTDYGRLLIFEHATAYLDTMYGVAHGPKNTGFYTYHDALKVYFMASQLVSVIRDAEDLLLSGGAVSIPMPPPSSGQAGAASVAPPPPLPANRNRAHGDTNLARSLRCLEGVPQLLERWGERWADAYQLSEGFELMFGKVLERLRDRKTVEDSIKARQDASPPLVQQQRSSHPHHQHHHSQPGFQYTGPPPPSTLQHQHSMPPPSQAQVRTPIPQSFSHDGVTLRPVSQPQMPSQLVTQFSHQHVHTPIMQSASPHPGGIRWVDMEMARMMQAGQQQQPHAYIKSEHDV